MKVSVTQLCPTLCDPMDCSPPGCFVQEIFHIILVGQKDHLEKRMVTHSSNLAWRSPWTEVPGRLQSMGSQRAGHTGRFVVSVTPLVLITSEAGKEKQVSGFKGLTM